VTSIAAPFLLLLGLFVSEGEVPAAGSRSAGGTTPAVVAPEGGDGTARVAAREALAEGNRRLKAGDVAAAIESYQRAQTLYPPAAAKIEFNIAKAEESRGDTPAAAAAFERFLAQAQDSPADFRKEARDELARLSATLGTLQVDQTRAGLSVVIDGQARAQTPVERGLWVRPGRHVITLEQGDRVLFRDSVEVVAGATARVNAALPVADAETAKPPPPALALAAPAPPNPPLVTPPPSEPPSPAAPAEPSDRPIWKRWWFWTGIAAVAVAGTATLLILHARDDCTNDSMTFCHTAITGN
jgi:hypothetical protein